MPAASETAVEVARVERQLRERGAPRGHMLGIVLTSGTVSLFTSIVLLKAGIASMAIRYPIAVVSGYAAFLGFVRLWLHVHRNAVHASEDPETLEVMELAQLPAELAANGLSAGDAAGLGIEAEAMPIAIVGGILAIAVGAIAYTVYIAPPLFAELLVDMAVTGGVYRQLRGKSDVSWLRRAFRRTVVPAAVMTGLFAIAGLVIQHAYPGAISLGAVWDSLFR